MSFPGLLPDSCLVKRPSGENEHGRSTGFNDVGPFPCRFDPQEGKIVEVVNGEDIVIDGVIYFKATAGILADDELVVASDRFVVVQVNKQKGFAKVHHLEVTVKKK